MSDLLKSQKIYKTMLLYCLKFRKNTVSQNANVSKKYKQNLILLSKQALCDSKKSRFIEKQEASTLFSDLYYYIVQYYFWSN